MNHGINLSDEQVLAIREYINSKKLFGIGRQKLASLILADLKIKISGVTANRIRSEITQDLSHGNDQKQAAIRSTVLAAVEDDAPLILQYIKDEIRDLREMAGYGDDGKKQPIDEMSVIDRTRLSNQILNACDKLIEILGPPKPDRHIQTTIEVLETADVGEYMRYGDKNLENEEKSDSVEPDTYK